MSNNLILEIAPNFINSNAKEVCRILNDAGYQAYLVGGCVRDLLLKTSPKDWDIATGALPEMIMTIFPKNYPTGLKHGTVTVSINDELFEITTFRTEGEYKDGRRPEEVFFVTNIEQDLARRDLTINAMAFDPLSNSLIDPFNGRSDLKAGIIKAVNSADVRFKEDGLRIMRCCRFAARFGWKIENSTLEAMKNNVNMLEKISKERIKDEFCKILMSKFSKKGLKILKRTKISSIIMNNLLSNINEYIQSKYEFDGELETRLAFLGFGLDLKIFEKELFNWKFSNKEIKKTIFLLHLLNNFLSFDKNESIDSYKTFMAFIKNESPIDWNQIYDQLIILIESVGLSTANLNKYSSEIVLSKKEMNINGNDLLISGIKSGPEIKKMLDKCYLEILKNPENNNKETLLELI